MHRAIAALATAAVLLAPAAADAKKKPKPKPKKNVPEFALKGSYTAESTIRSKCRILTGGTSTETLITTTVNRLDGDGPAATKKVPSTGAMGLTGQRTTRMIRDAEDSEYLKDYDIQGKPESFATAVDFGDFVTYSPKRKEVVVHVNPGKTTAHSLTYKLPAKGRSIDIPVNRYKVTPIDKCDCEYEIDDSKVKGTLTLTRTK